MEKENYILQEHVNMPLKAIVTSINKDNTVNVEIHINDLENGANQIPVSSVPIMKTVNESEVPNLNHGDNVIIMHLDGSIAKPVIVGKF
ncbi:hypothetical protein [Methanobacterium sp. MBAC-LM]|uniref:hypothetical protein n=1 Tax=Methanobacterium sp. MBAC-LM TaxID=3412034 RepID=UPI003C70C462